MALSVTLRVSAARIEVGSKLSAIASTINPQTARFFQSPLMSMIDRLSFYGV